MLLPSAVGFCLDAALTASYCAVGPEYGRVCSLTELDALASAGFCGTTLAAKSYM